MSAFGNSTLAKDGKQAYCRNCRNAYMREWKKRNRHKTRAYMADYRSRLRDKHCKAEQKTNREVDD